MSASRLTSITSTLLLVAIGAFSGSAHAADLRLQVGTTPGFDSLDENAKDITGATYDTERTMSQDPGMSIGVIMTWAKPEGVSFLRGAELSYRTEGGSLSNGKSFESSQIGVGGRLGIGWVVTPGLRLEGGGRAMVGYAQTSDARDSIDGYLHNNQIIYVENQTAVGVGYQFGAFVGVNYTFEKHFLLGAELGYEYTGAFLAATYLTSRLSGAGATFALNAGYVF